MKKVYFYIGSNNQTHQLETDKIEAAVAKYFAEFTTYEVIGYWRGQRERSLKIEILTEEAPAHIARIAKELKNALQQDAILMEIIESNAAFIQ